MIQVNNKFEIGQKVYYLDNKKKCCCEAITYISATIHDGGKVTVYYSTQNSYAMMREDEVFATEQDVKKYVFNDLIEFL